MKRKAFTLIELLTVIAVIAVLLSILSPVLVGIVGVGKRTVCGNDMSKLGQAYTHYSSDNKWKLMSSNTRWDNQGGTTLNRCWVGAGNTVRSIEDGQMWPYVESMAPYRCTNPVNDEYLRSYSINGKLNGERIRTDRMSGITEPSRCLLMIEEDDFRGYNVNSWYVASTDRWVDFVSGNHDGGDNLIFADGHMEYWKWEDPDTLSLPYNDAPFGTADPGSVDLLRLWEVFRPH